MPRNYKREYSTYQGTEEQKKRRAERNKARRKAMKEGKVHKGDGKDVHHPTKNTASKKVKVMSKSRNRADNGHRPGERQKRKK